MRWWLSALLLFASCQSSDRPKSMGELRAEVQVVLSEMGMRLSQVESHADFMGLGAALEADHLKLAHLIGTLKEQHALPPTEESLAMLQTKERLEEQVVRIREMEGGSEWLVSIQRSARMELDRIEVL